MRVARPLSAALKFGVLGALYFSQGLPFGFFTQALPVLMRKQGYSLGAIGLSSLAAAPWALKFLWAPAVDRYSLARLGRRKSWIVPLQLAALLILIALALTRLDMPRLLGAFLLLNLVAATQDIATDGLAVDLLAERERGFGNGLQVAAYRVGMIVGGGALLLLYDVIGSRGVFASMAALTLVATLPVWIAREPPVSPAVHGQPGTGRHFLRRPGALRVLLLLGVYKAGDAFATGMLRPFLSDLGLTLEDIGLLLGTVGFCAGLAGALVGGVLIERVGRRAALVSFGLLQVLAVAGYAGLALGKPGFLALCAWCGAEHFASGMASAALFTCMMDWCSEHSSATDYTVQACAVVIATGAASSLAGFSAQAFGYFVHFCLAGVLALAAIGAVRALFPTPDTVRALRH
jgi:MFS transporter, PAT family, beta-lactamase induction signal transducer AmpG